MAARYWVGGNANWDNTAGTKWATTSGGAGGAAVPTSADDVHLDNGAGTGNVTITISAVCKTLDCTGYVNTLAGTTNLTVSGSVTFVAGMTLTWSGTLFVNAASTLTSNGQTLPGNLELRATATFTLGDNWAITGSYASNVGTVTIAGAKTLTVAGGFSIGTTTAATATFILTGGTWSGSAQVTATEIKFQGNVSINNNAKCTGNKITYVSGTVTPSGTFNLSNCTLDTNGITWVNILQVTNQTWTLLSDLTISGNLTGVGANTLAINGAFNCNVGGNLVQTGGAWSGTAKIVFTGTGTWTGAGSNFGLNVDFNASGTISLSGTIIYNVNKTMTYVAGTISPGTSVLQIASTCTLNMAGGPLYNLTVSSNSTITLSSLLTVNNTITISSSVTAVTFAGTGGFTCANFIATTSASAMGITFRNSTTFIITSSLTLTGTAALRITVQSNSAATAFTFTLNYGATQSVSYVTSTDADSSLGQTIWDYKGVLTRTVNWNILTPSSVGTISKGFVC